MTDTFLTVVAQYKAYLVMALLEDHLAANVRHESVLRTYKCLATFDGDSKL